jgi:hypothetical protein
MDIINVDVNEFRSPQKTNASIPERLKRYKDKTQTDPQLLEERRKRAERRREEYLQRVSQKAHDSFPVLLHAIYSRDETNPAFQANIDRTLRNLSREYTSLSE